MLFSRPSAARNCIKTKCCTFWGVKPYFDLTINPLTFNDTSLRLSMLSVWYSTRYHHLQDKLKVQAHSPNNTSSPSS